MALLAPALISACFIALASGHGKMQDPPQRSTLWRYYPQMGFEKNYNDNELFCGGFSVQWFQNDGKCGTCGDAYDGDREHEAGGKYATGFISKRYKQGQDIEVEIKLTANHLGFFEFKLCPQNDVTTPVTQECMDMNVLHLAGQPGVTRYEPGSQNGIHHVKLSLPADMTCEQCVLQWRYKAGNNHNCDKEAPYKCCKGCGAQETFVNCADIAIDADSVTSPKPVPTTSQITKKDTTPAPTTTPTPAPTTTPTPEPTTTHTPAPTTTHTPAPTTTTTPAPTTAKPTTMKPTTHSPTTARPQTTPQPSPSTTPQPSITSGTHVTSCAANEIIDCVGVGVYKGLGYESWCNSYCGGGRAACTAALCHCTCKRKTTCYGVGDFVSLPGIDKWCTDMCKYGCNNLQDFCGCT